MSSENGHSNWVKNYSLKKVSNYLGDKRVQIEISIDVLPPDHIELSRDCFGGQKRIKLDEEIYATEGPGIARLAGVPQTINIIIEVAKVAYPIAAGVVSAWIYDKLKNRNVESIRIKGTKTEIRKETIEIEIKKALEEKSR
ncbi:MAG: hypothetical protein OEY73_06345 [Hadesarchaea archaeon]|nr:hypothetical protein [Hadesarchaea archaeon]